MKDAATRRRKQTTGGRKYILVGVVAALAIAAVWLRVRGHLSAATDGGTDVPSLQASSQPAVRPIPIPVPRDYVVNPVVSPDELNAGPLRIVSLAPSVTEIVCALGMRDRLVGRTRYCVWPPDIENVPMVGVMAESNYGMVKALDPDLVLATRNSGETIANLTRLGLRCEGVPHVGLPEVYAAIEKIGELCGRPKTARALAAAIQQDMDRMRAEAARRYIKPRRVIVLFGELPVPPKAVFVAGPGLYLDDLVTYAGCQNAARDVLKSSQGEIPLEVLRVLNPEVILEFREPAGPDVMKDVYEAWSQVGGLQAIAEHRLRSVGGLEWLSAGPRIAIELHRFISVLSEFQ